jgi:predicted DNA-binding transcriptional regulator AlpA
MHMTVKIKSKSSPAPTPPINAPEVRLLSKLEVLDRVGRSYATIWTWMLEGKFPRSRDVNGRASWIESEVVEWINSLPVRQLKGEYDEDHSRYRPPPGKRRTVKRQAAE